jgi:ArsR family transcriptional regulator, arsenate/arsenite/antimonite-responsive transcriptional repressor / arsenate reductase (thioredoxin)
MIRDASRDLVDRARRHAALADVSRLAIVDALAWTDLSPGEVGRMLGLPSNLVAHHLTVLRAAGLVTQVRSEGDRRRAYLQLTHGAFDGLVTLTPRAAPRVVFVCRHNSARSQLAAALWRRASRVPAASAGTDPADRVHPATLAVARRHRLPVGEPRTRALADVVRPTDLLVSVCDEAYEEMADTGPRRVLHWSVPDPVRAESSGAFEAAYTQIAERVGRAATVIEKGPRQ